MKVLALQYPSQALDIRDILVSLYISIYILIHVCVSIADAQLTL